jgi:hypothetical protein
VRNRIVVAGAVLVTVAACSSTAEVTAGPATASAAPPAAATTVPVRTSDPAPPRTPAPVTEDAPCPYAGADVVADTVGQRIARTTVTRTSPHVGCAFYRPNGEKAADVAVSVLASAAAAQERAVAFPGAGANPVDSVADGGAVKITADGAVLAVSKGAALVVVRINQTVSLEAVEIAKLVVATL